MTRAEAIWLDSTAPTAAVIAAATDPLISEGHRVSAWQSERPGATLVHVQLHEDCDREDLLIGIAKSQARRWGCWAWHFSAIAADAEDLFVTALDEDARQRWFEVSDVDRWDREVASLALQMGSRQQVTGGTFPYWKMIGELGALPDEYLAMFGSPLLEPKGRGWHVLPR